ncbi:MAG: tripartite tricarboxylate transporter TctB family protein [Burkholderiales bacterium]|nr:tripartite tricarboxylate transporter TctB family protein [Burkholderiales bacterium]MDQ3195069.1 tripartite tricarboxylate transporter TctB family protein [Pseudomonadota bacterium]
MAVAIVLLCVAALVIYDSQRVGTGWASDGPEAGYFPFYIGALLAAASIWILFQAILRKTDEVFVAPDRFQRVLAVFIPTALYIATIYFIGIYLASAFFLALFMRRYGKFDWRKTLPVSLLVPVVLFLLFEIWFLVPLPKGPLENLFGY